MVVSAGMMLQELLSRRLLVVTGKGGVGKSTVAAALALAARRRGRRVLLVEVDARREAAADLAGAGIETLNLTPRDALDDYVRHVVKIEGLARRILKSPVYDRFLAAAPGLPELVILGKIMALEEARERWARRPRYDLIVVDAPATGHGLSLLRAPLVAAQAVPVGPVGHNARRVLALLRDGKRTALVVVATPEEMAVVEALELNRQAVDELGMHPAAAVLNLCHEQRFTREQEAQVLKLSAAGADGLLAPGVGLAGALLAARRQIRRRKLTRFYQDRLRRALALPLVSLPRLFAQELGRDGVSELADRLEAA